MTNQSLKTMGLVGARKTLPKTDILMPAFNILKDESFTKIELQSFSSLANCTENGKAGDGEALIGKGIKMVIEMAETFSALREEMRRQIEPKSNCMTRNSRPFRQKFFKVARKSKGLSYEELCEALNRHPEILNLERLPGFKYFYPITRELLEKLENNIAFVPEYQPYCAGFFAPGIAGTPTKDIAAVISKICGVTKQHEEFVQLSLQYEFGYETVATWNAQ